MNIKEYNKRYRNIYGVDVSDLTPEEVEKYNSRWFVAYFLKENYGEFYTYQPRKFKNSIEILVQGSALVMYNTRKRMLEFDEYKGKVYRRLG